jgi:hypothetical protein
MFAVALAFILPIVTSAQVSVTVDAPAAVRPGDEFRVSITVNKSGIDGFATDNEAIHRRKVPIWYQPDRNRKEKGSLQTINSNHRNGRMGST